MAYSTVEWLDSICLFDKWFRVVLIMTNVRFLIFMFIRHNLTFKASRIGIAIIKKLIHICLVEQFIFLFELIDFDRALCASSVIAVSLIVDIRLPFSEIVFCRRKIIILFSSRFIVVIFILRGFN